MTAEDLVPDDVQAELRGTAEGRRLLASVERSFFGVHYLGLRYAPHQEVWYDLVDKRRRLLILSPRDHGKTEALCRVIPDHRIAYNRDSRILVVSKIGTEAQKRVNQVRADLAGNARLIADYGAFSPHAPSEKARRRVDGDDKATWTQDKFVVAGRTQNLRDPTMEGVGIGGSITGGHFDLIILDDPVDLLEAQSQAQRNMHWNWFLGTVLELCEPNTQIVVIGTRKHADDLYGRIIEDEMTFSVHTDKAILKWPSKVTYLTERQGERDVVVDVMTSDDYKVLAPWKWSINDLMLKYQSDSVTFLRENQNELTDDSKSIFRQAYFFGGAVSDKPGLVFPGIFDKSRVLLKDGDAYAKVDGVDVLQAWDLSLLTDKKQADQRDTDFMVGLSFGYDRRTKDRYLFSMFRDRGLLPTQVIGTIERECKHFKAVWTAIENNSFGHLHEIGLRRTTDVPIVPHTTDKKKHDPFEGVPRLTSVFETGKWHIPYGDAYSRQIARLIMGEFTGLGVEAHDDIVMCVTPGAMVTTRRGPVEIERVVEGDQVLSHTGRWCRVTGTTNHHHQGEIVRVKAAGRLPFGLTPEHPVWSSLPRSVWSREGGKRKNRLVADASTWAFRPVSGVRSGRKMDGDYVFSPKPSWPAKETRIDLAQFAGNTERTLRCGGPKWKVSETEVWWRSDRRMPRCLEVDEEFGFFVGLYLAEGSIGGGDGKHLVQFALNARETYIVSFIEAYAERCFSAPTRLAFPHGESMVATFGSRIAAQLLGPIGHSENKAMPWEWMGWPLAVRLAIVRGWMVGDGHAGKTQGSGRPILGGTSISRGIIEQMYLTLLEGGFAPRVTAFKNANPTWQVWLTAGDSAHLLACKNEVERQRWPQDFAKNQGASNRRSQDVDGGVALRLQSLERECYDGPVYNLHVEGDESYVIEGVAVHNCFWIAECLIERYENFLKRVERGKGRAETRRAETRRR